MKKILIIGLGSIGQRHVEALLSLGVENIAALRTGKGKKSIDNDILNKIAVFNNDVDAFNWNPTHIIISNPTSLHKSYIDLAIKHKCKFFVEKPIADNTTEISNLINNPEINGVVGYNLRFHGLFQFLKEKVESKEYGDVVTSQLHVGQYLPNWHPYEDYREAYYSRKDLGGGAIRTLSHEIDLAQFLFGKVNSVLAKVQKLSKLEIDVDDVVNIFCKTELCEQINIHINFLDPVVVRKGTIYFDDGLISYDFINSQVSYTSYETKQEEIIYSKKEDYNIQYRLQMKEFLSNEKESTACSFEQGINVMKIIEKSEESNLKQKEICLV